MKIKVNVTAKDIKRGKRGSECSCPVALAVKRTFGTKRVQVNPDIFVKLPSAEIDFAPIKEVEHFVDDFDNGKNVKPFSFTLSL